MWRLYRFVLAGQANYLSVATNDSAEYGTLCHADFFATWRARDSHLAVSRESHFTAVNGAFICLSPVLLGKR